jgi:hypothetical protein
MEPAQTTIVNTSDPDLYRYGLHAPEFWVNLTVGPGTDTVYLRFSERRPEGDPTRRPMSIFINGRKVLKGFDVAARAGGLGKALDLSFDGIRPKNEIIEIRFIGTDGGEAMVQALALTPTSDSEEPGDDS